MVLFFFLLTEKNLPSSNKKKKGNFSKSQTKLDDDYFALSSIYSLNRYIYIEKIESKHFYISYAAVWVAFVYIFEQAVYTHKRSWVSRTTSRHYQQKENKSFRFFFIFYIILADLIIYTAAVMLAAVQKSNRCRCWNKSCPI